MLMTLKIGIEEGIKYIPFIIGASVVFRLARFPDVGIQGTFLVGASALAYALNHGFNLFFTIILIIISGSLGGLITGFLFKKFQLNSLLCGIVTLFISYSVSFLLLGDPSVDINHKVFNCSYLFIALLGMFIIIVISVGYATKYGLVVNFAIKSPTLSNNFGINFYSKICILLILGNSISALGGAIVAYVEGSVSINEANGLLFLAIISLVIGEGIFFMILSLINYLKIFKLSYIERFLSSEIFVLLFSAYLGAIAYWVIFNLGCLFWGSNEYTKGLLGFSMAGVFIITSKVLSKDRKIPRWQFF